MFLTTENRDVKVEQVSCSCCFWPLYSALDALQTLMLPKDFFCSLKCVETAQSMGDSFYPGCGQKTGLTS